MTSLPPEVEASYSAIIDSILAASDLNTISAKRIRKGLQEKVDYDISHQKEQVTALIMARFDKFNSERNGPPDPEPAEPIPTIERAIPATNGTKAPAADSSEGSASAANSKKRTPDDESAVSELEQSAPKKKQKKNKSIEEDDAAYAARLQAEENLKSRARSTRGGNTKKRVPAAKKKSGKKKSANKVKEEDDSDIGSGSGAEKKEVKRTGGFHKPMTLSAPLSELLGETSLSRPQTVKKIWEYVKERDLQDPNDKRQIRCDEAMRAVFKQDRVHMFTMNKILNQNLYAQDE
ncbi:SWIB-domain-containing protein [Lindgomyces ingoldianus]|uniref:SWIB-domain-containing protein n=1 Tax=Lindgomyces ingoldianus TaxID=673940 RepID=A0ACB6R6Q3_9PLEO|nr:SWIB-domain-containing protein [Lindgomyces ingoldianus]KAF2474752.1 SWIB-domain-containing protein [Lindgomyces ingoldianus]